MKKLLILGLGLSAFAAIGAYFLFPGTLLELALAAGRHAAGLNRKEIRIQDHTIHYLEGGKGQTILLLHGFGASKESWIRFARHLTGGYRVVIPDLPGFGQSSRIPAASYDMETQLKRIELFAEALIPDKFHLAGNSMGGTLAALYAAEHPRRIATLALLAPGGVGSPRPSELAKLIQKGINPLLTGNAEDFDRLLELCFAKPPFIPSQFKKVMASAASLQRNFNQKIWNDMVGSRAHGASFLMENFLEPYLSRIQAPVLIIWGNADHILDVGGAAVLERSLKNAKTVVMENIGHAPMLEDPRDTASHYLNHLKGVF